MAMTTSGLKWRFQLLAVTLVDPMWQHFSCGGDYGGSELSILSLGGDYAGLEVEIYSLGSDYGGSELAI